MSLPPLYVHVGAARHFLRWELPHLRRHFRLIREPSNDAALLAFGPDTIESGAALPATHRFLVQFPGFGHNPLHDLGVRAHDLEIFDASYDLVFVNPGPLQLAYASSARMVLFPVSIDVDFVAPARNKYRTELNSLLHVSSRTAQKDWERSASIMKKTGFASEVFPPRDSHPLVQKLTRATRRVTALRAIGLRPAQPLPLGYVGHRETIAKYRSFDGFVHIARDVGNKTMIDGKYTAALMEAALTGAIVFWHDTLQLGNDFETIFDAPVATDAAAAFIRDVGTSIDVTTHSRATAEEMREKADPRRSVEVRAERMLEVLSTR